MTCKVDERSSIICDFSKLPHTYNEVEDSNLQRYEESFFSTFLETRLNSIEFSQTDVKK